MPFTQFPTKPIARAAQGLQGQQSGSHLAQGHADAPESAGLYGTAHNQAQLGLYAPRRQGIGAAPSGSVEPTSPTHMIQTYAPDHTGWHQWQQPQTGHESEGQHPGTYQHSMQADDEGTQFDPNDFVMDPRAPGHAPQQQQTYGRPPRPLGPRNQITQNSAYHENAAAEPEEEAEGGEHDAAQHEGYYDGEYWVDEGHADVGQ